MSVPILQTSPVSFLQDAFDQFQNLWRHFDDGGWMWKNYYVKPDGRVDFRVKLPKIDTSWMVGAFAVGRDTGLSIMHRPATLSGKRFRGTRGCLLLTMSFLSEIFALNVTKLPQILLPL